MSERPGGDIVDFHLGAFDREQDDKGREIGDSIAVVYAYDTKSVPRRPAEVIYAPHRAYVDYAEVKRHEIPADDPRIVALGITAAKESCTIPQLGIAGNEAGFYPNERLLETV
jgi:hypothetical protein